MLSDIQQIKIQSNYKTTKTQFFYGKKLSISANSWLDVGTFPYSDLFSEDKRQSSDPSSEEMIDFLDGDDVPLVEEVAEKQFWNR